MDDIACFLVEKANVRTSGSGRTTFDLRRVDDGAVMAKDTYGLFLGDSVGQVPAGAMQWVLHRPGATVQSPMDHHDGTELHLLVVTPGGTWCTGCPATGGGAWTLEGEAPNVTATPSIDIPGRWHGWLRDGVLTEA